jgi:hypothetical protein
VKIRAGLVVGRSRWPNFRTSPFGSTCEGNGHTAKLGGEARGAALRPIGPRRLEPKWVPIASNLQLGFSDIVLHATETAPRTPGEFSAHKPQPHPMHTLLILWGVGCTACLGFVILLIRRAPLGEETSDGFKELTESEVNEMKPAPAVVPLRSGPFRFVPVLFRFPPPLDGRRRTADGREVFLAG